MALGTNFYDYLLESLKDKEVAFEYVLAAFEEPGDGVDDIGFLMVAIDDVAKVYGCKNNFSRESIYKMLQEGSTASTKNVSKIFDSLGIKIASGNV